MMTTGDAEKVNSEVSGDSLDQARAMYAAAYNGAEFASELTDQDFSYRYTARGDHDLTLRTSTFLGQIQGTIQPEDEYVVSWLSAGGGAVDIGGEEQPFQLGTPMMFPTGKRFTFSSHDFRQNLVHFNAAYLERIAAEHEGVLPGPLHFDHTANLSPKALRQWRSTVNVTAEVILQGDPAPLLRAEVNRVIAVALLDTFPHHGPLLPDVLLRPGQARLRTAVEYLHHHAAEPVTVTDLAEVVGLSPRGLQVAFRNHLGTTPLGYLRDVRLDRIRAELLALGPTESTVGAVARRWGFAHQGRFSALYAARFHEYPTVTLAST